MKKYFILYKLFFLSLPAFAQVTISSGAKWVTTGNATVTLQDIDLVNNGSFTAAQGKVKFSGDQSNGITGSSLTTFNELEIDKSGINTLVLFSNVGVNNKITFTSGMIELNQKTITLGSNATLNNENENSRIIGLSGGEVTITASLNKPTGVNPGNLGAIFTGTTNLGTVVIKRGHAPQSGTGLLGSTNRYYDISVSGKKPKPTIRLKYFDAELNGQDESLMEFYQSMNNGSTWSAQSFNSRDIAANWVEKTNMSSFARLTLSNNAGAPVIVHSPNTSSPENIDMAKKLTVGPNPNNGNFWFKCAGISKDAPATLYTIDGKIIRQFKVSNLQQQQVSGLKSGLYILKVDGLPAFRVVVQSDGTPNGNPVTNSTSDNTIKY